MATQSLYRRYRPRRFSEIRGQQHVVRALRDAVVGGREGQAYLFSGPRGTGKTTSARILAKVLNCENVHDGEPCCECESCKAVENGTSYDVHELDAASNNGVDAIRDLIEKASLGTPGRHKVYILDEVHMLSKGAEAALLKTLEEPPPHVVFVLATTDPQKMSDTIRSRTQHLQFHLLPSDELAEHVRWVADDAGLDLTDEAFEAALTRGGGSARDTLSALELLVATGGEVGDAADLDAFLSALIARDAGAALAAMANAVSLGLDPRAITEDLVRHLRNGFLSLMAPDLVVMAPERLAELTEQAREFGAAGLVRAIERLGGALTDMRNAPDPRVLVEVALVQLTHTQASGDAGAVAALEARVQQLEQQIASGVAPVASGAAAPSRPAEPATATGQAAPAPAAAPRTGPAPAGPGGRKVLGGAAQRAKEAAERARQNARREPGKSTAPNEPRSSAEPAPQQAPQPEPQPAERPEPQRAPSAERPAAPAHPQPAPQPEPRPAAAAPTPAAAPSGSIIDAWEQTVKGGLKPMVRALYSAGELRDQGGTAQFVVSTDIQVTKCNEHRATVEQALSQALGGSVTVEIVTGGQSPTAELKAAEGAAAANERELEDESDIDLDDLTDAPPESVKTPIDHLAEAFPGSEMIEEQ